MLLKLHAAAPARLVKVGDVVEAAALLAIATLDPPDDHRGRADAVSAKLPALVVPFRVREVDLTIVALAAADDCIF